MEVARDGDRPPMVERRVRITTPGILLGMGLGGFVDGILLHQVLGWHHLLSETDEHPPDTLAGLETNVVADGLFHAATWVFVAVGLALLWRAVGRGAGVWSWRSLLGWMLVGWGAFNLVEGTVNHHLLGIHRVRPDAAAPLAYDLGFLALGAVLVVAGWQLARSDRPDDRLAGRAGTGPALRSGRGAP